MISLNTYRQVLTPNPLTVGNTHRAQANLVMEKTWNRDLQAKICYIYDYLHDSEPDKNYHLHPEKDELKTPIEAKYVVSQYGSLSKDQVEYHIQFRPSQECPIGYYSQTFEKMYGAEFPIGLYIDIPDEKGIYRRWMICGRDHDLQFVSYSILPCNYYFHWINNNKKCKMWGIARLRNSYNSGLWAEYRTTSVENQDQIWLPQNPLSDTLEYVENQINQRIIISARRTQPLVWKVSKVENLHPLGINKITVMQTQFNQHTDYVVPVDEADSVFEMYADYYSSPILPEEDELIIPTSDYSEIVSITKPPTIYIGGGYKTFLVNFYNANNELVNNAHTMSNCNWKLLMKGEDILPNTDLVNCEPVQNDNYYQIKIKFYGNNNRPDDCKDINYNEYRNQVLTLEVTDDNGECLSSINVALVR